jgi:hypothetical protein
VGELNLVGRGSRKPQHGDEGTGIRQTTDIATILGAPSRGPALGTGSVIPLHPKKLFRESGFQIVGSHGSLWFDLYATPFLFVVSIASRFCWRMQKSTGAICPR